MASGLEFVGRLNDSLKSSASTYIKSKSAERADAEKVLDSIDKEINYRERLITRYQNSTTRGKQSFGAYSQLYSQLSKIQSQNQDQIRSDRLKLDNELKALEAKNKTYYEEANKAIGNISSQIARMKKGQDLPADLVGAVISRLNKDKVSDEGKLVLFAFLANEVEKGQYPQSDELLNEIKRETAKVVKTGIDPIDSADKPDFLDPRKEASIFTPAVTDDFKAKVHNDPVLQNKFLGRVVTQTQDHSPALRQLYSLMFEDGTEGLSDVQVAQKVVSSISSSVPNTIGINQQGQVTLIQGADPADTTKAIDLLKRSGIEPGTTIAEAGRALKVQSGREDLSSLTNEIAQLKQRREIAVENLAKTPRLSTSKLALLDHPILRVPGFREAIGTVSARRITPSVIGAEKTDSDVDVEFKPTDFTDGDIEFGPTDFTAGDGKPGDPDDSVSDILEAADFSRDPRDINQQLEARAAIRNIDPVQGYDPTSVSLANRDTSVFRQGGADVIGGDVPSRARDLLDFAGGVPVIPAVATRIEKSLTDAINQSRQAGVDPVANERAQANLANITEDFNRLPENIRRAFPRRFRDALENMETKGENPEQQIVQIENALASLEDVALTGQSVGEYIATVDPNDPDQIEGLGNLLEFVDNPEALGDRASVLVGFEQPRPYRGTMGYVGLSDPGTPILGGIGMRLRNNLESQNDPTAANTVRNLIGRAQKLSAENYFYDPPGTYGTNQFFNILEEQSKEPVPTRQDEPPNIDFKQTADQIKIDQPDQIESPPAVNQIEVDSPNVVEIEGEPVDLSPSMTPVNKPQAPPVDTKGQDFTAIRNLTPEQIKVVNTTLDFADKNPGKADAALGSLSNALEIPIEDLKNFRNDSPTPMGNPASPKMTDDEIKSSLMRSINTLAEGAEDFPRTPTERNIDTLAQGADDKMPTLGEASTMITVDPLPSKTINRPYFTEPRDHPILDDARGHKGIDIAAKEGDPIQLIASGTVSSVKRDPMGSAGIKVEVDHPNGMRTKYFHGSGIPDDIQVGQQLDAGTTIMFAGSSGVYTSGPKKGQPSSTGPHLHFEVGEVKDGQFIAMDPEDVFPEIFGEYKRKREDQGNPSDEDVLMQYM